MENAKKLELELESRLAFNLIKRLDSQYDLILDKWFEATKEKNKDLEEKLSELLNVLACSKEIVCEKVVALDFMLSLAEGSSK